jgi:hypothetical protein
MWLGARQAPVFTGGVFEGSSSSSGSKCSGASRHAFNARADAARLVTRTNGIYYAAMLGLKRDDLRIHIGRFGSLNFSRTQSDP